MANFIVEKCSSSKVWQMAAADDLPDVILLGNTDHAHLLNLLNVTSNFAVASNVSGGFRCLVHCRLVVVVTC